MIEENRPQKRDLVQPRDRRQSRLGPLKAGIGVTKEIGQIAGHQGEHEPNGHLVLPQKDAEHGDGGGNRRTHQGTSDKTRQQAVRLQCDDKRRHGGQQNGAVEREVDQPGFLGDGLPDSRQDNRRRAGDHARDNYAYVKFGHIFPGLGTAWPYACVNLIRRHPCIPSVASTRAP